MTHSPLSPRNLALALLLTAAPGLLAQGTGGFFDDLGRGTGTGTLGTGTGTGNGYSSTGTGTGNGYAGTGTGTGNGHGLRVADLIARWSYSTDCGRKAEDIERYASELTDLDARTRKELLRGFNFQCPKSLVRASEAINQELARRNAPFLTVADLVETVPSMLPAEGVEQYFTASLDDLGEVDLAGRRKLLSFFNFQYPKTFRRLNLAILQRFGALQQRQDGSLRTLPLGEVKAALPSMFPVDDLDDHVLESLPYVREISGRDRAELLQLFGFQYPQSWARTAAAIDAAATALVAERTPRGTGTGTGGAPLQYLSVADMKGAIPSMISDCGVVRGYLEACLPHLVIRRAGEADGLLEVLNPYRCGDSRSRFQRSLAEEYSRRGLSSGTGNGDSSTGGTGTGGYRAGTGTGTGTGTGSGY